MDAKLFFFFLVTLFVFSNAQSGIPFAPFCTPVFIDGIAATTHSSYSFVIQSRDSSMNLITIDNAIYVVTTSTLGVAITQPIYTGSGTYTGSIATNSTGYVIMHIELTNQGPDTDIQNSPFNISVLPAVPFALNCLLSFSDGDSGLTNHVYHFIIQSVAEDLTDLTTGGANFTVDVTPSDGVTVYQPTDNGDGTYSSSFSTSVSGTYLLSVQLAGVDVSGSPFSINIMRQTANSGLTTATGNGVTGGTYVLHKANFTVVTRDSFDVPLTFGGTSVAVSIKHLGLNHPFAFIDNEDGTYSGSYIPIIPFGSYIVTIKIGGVNIVGSPWTINFLI